jgi:hypothetical protein
LRRGGCCDHVCIDRGRWRWWWSDMAVAVTALMMWWLWCCIRTDKGGGGKTFAVTWWLPDLSPSAVVVVVMDRDRGRDVPALIILIPRSSPALHPPQLLILLILILTRSHAFMLACTCNRSPLSPVMGAHSCFWALSAFVST